MDVRDVYGWTNVEFINPERCLRIDDNIGYNNPIIYSRFNAKIANFIFSRFDWWAIHVGKY